MIADSTRPPCSSFAFTSSAPRSTQDSSPDPRSSLSSTPFTDSASLFTPWRSSGSSTLRPRRLVGRRRRFVVSILSSPLCSLPVHVSLTRTPFSLLCPLSSSPHPVPPLPPQKKKAIHLAFPSPRPSLAYWKKSKRSWRCVGRACGSVWSFGWRVGGSGRCGIGRRRTRVGVRRMGGRQRGGRSCSSGSSRIWVGFRLDLDCLFFF